MRNEAGEFILEGTFLDAHLYPIGAGTGMYLRAVELSYEKGIIYIGDADNDTVCTGEFDIPIDVNDIRLLDSYGRPAGILVSEPARLALIQSWGNGLHSFEPGDTPFVASCCMPTPEIGVRGIVLEDGSLFAGPVWIMGDDGVALRYEEAELPATKCGESARTVQVIRVDVVGDPLFQRRLCTDVDLFQTPNPVRKIQIKERGNPVALCAPDENGNISIQMNNSEAVDTALRVRTTDEGLVFEVVGDSTVE